MFVVLLLCVYYYNNYMYNVFFFLGVYRIFAENVFLNIFILILCGCLICFMETINVA